MRTLVIFAMFVAIIAVAACRWIRGYRSEWENAAADAVVHDLAESTRRLHHAHQAKVLGLPDGPDDGGEAA